MVICCKSKDEGIVCVFMVWDVVLKFGAYDLWFATNEMRAETNNNSKLMQFWCCTTGHRLIETEGYGGL